MLCTLLRKNFPQLGPDEKYLIASFAACYGHASAELTVKEMAKALHISPRVVAKNLTALIDKHELLRAEFPARWEGKGKPARRYAIASELLDELGSRQNSEYWPGQADLAKRVLTGEVELFRKTVSDDEAMDSAGVGYKSPPRRVKGDGGSIRLRLFTAVLVCHSDELGVVRGLRGEKLYDLTGIGAAQVRLNAKQLVSSGVLLGHVPGTSSKWFAESKAASTYYLDMPTSLDVMRRNLLRLEFYSDFDVWGRVLEPIARQKWPWMPVIRRGEVRAVLVSELMGEVSYILSTYWEDLDGAQSFYDKHAEKCGLERRVRGILRVPDEVLQAKNAPLNLEKIIYEGLVFSCIEQACLVKRWLQEPTLSDLSVGKVQLLPVSTLPDGQLCMPVVVAGGLGEARCIRLNVPGE